MGEVMRNNAARENAEKGPQPPAVPQANPADKLTPVEARSLLAVRARSRDRVPAPRLKIDHKPDRPLQISAQDGRDTGLEVQMLATFGTTSQDFSNRILNDLLEAGCRGSNATPFKAGDVNGALAAIHGIAPTDEIEAMLAVQMLATHSAAMRCLRQLKGADNILQQDSNGSLAVKFLKVYTMQIEALQRHRGGGEQKMTVHHVHVHEGGQAIVGEVNAARAGDRVPEKLEGQPHAVTHAPGETLPSALQAHREAVPSAGR